MQDYHKLKAWKKASDLVDLVFIATGGFPRFGDGKLADQLQRASCSIVMNICEGCGKKGGADFLKYLQNAMRSATEVEGGVELSRNRRFLDATQSALLLDRVIEVKKLLTGLMKSLGNTWGPADN
jgi:four helix bundle protein